MREEQEKGADFLRTAGEIRKTVNASHHGRDEMNLIEFPFAGLADRVPRGVNMLEYDVEAWDSIHKRPVRRKTTVVGDAKYGLPTAKDEEVYLGLLQWTKLYNEFSSPLVRFCRAQLFDLMGWTKEKASYRRLLLAMDRLTGTKISYVNAWRDNTNKQWVDRERISILDSYRFRDSRKLNSVAVEDRLSQFRWGAELFASFESGYLKKLDYELAKSLSPVARRLYRFLDKHFYPPHRLRLEFDLRTLACEHLGVSRNADNSQIRDRYLTPAIAELVAADFLKPAKGDLRFQQIRRGHWIVRVECSAKGRIKKRTQTHSSRDQTVRPERRIYTAGGFVGS